MSEANSMCETCGGITGPFAQQVADAMSLTGRNRSFMCMGHSEPAEDNDADMVYGDLGNGAQVYHDNSWGMDHIAIRDRKGETARVTIKQFLQVLDWGERNKAELQRLAKEQAE